MRNLKVLWQRRCKKSPTKNRRACFSASHAFPWPVSPTRAAQPNRCCNWLTCATLNPATRAAPSQSICRSIARPGVNGRQMNEPKELNSLPALAEVNDERERALKRPAITSVRVSPGPYLAVGFVATFFAGSLLRTGYDVAGLLLVTIVWLITPLLGFTDRIVFDGVSVRRQGLLASFLHLLFGYRKQLAVDDFETLETQAVRTLRRGGSVRYRYRTQISGK